MYGISRIKTQLENIDCEVERISNQLAGMPAGSASIYKSKGRVRVKRRLDGKVTFLTNKDEEIAQQLLFKRYLLVRKKELSKEKAYLKERLAFEQKWRGKSIEFLINHPLLATEISSLFRKDRNSAKEWMNAPRAALAPHQEGRTEDAGDGLFVRSKSEVMIVASLRERGLYYRYKEPLYLADKLYFPDFTIRDPESGRIIWYEHFGMMDDENYARRTYDKLFLYSKNGILPMHNLITTFESGSRKLSISQINNALDAFFN